jgi:predicted amidohydrolase
VNFQNVDIIVFPEYALTTIAPYNKRHLALQFSQFVPGPDHNAIPCSMEIKETGEIVKKLSCAAKSNQIYVVANMLEKYEDTPSKELLVFNTNVVFDRTGKIIARYIFTFLCCMCINNVGN